ncbi:MAG: MscL family protein [Nitrososphaeraceae archaeon]|nr:MscL family protein [Nitrososphaeraceae archaeon]
MTDKESSYPLSPQDHTENKTFIQQFIDFLKTFGVIGLAIGFIIGVASTDLVNSLVEDIINPLIGLVLPSGSLENLSANVTSISGVESEFKYGNLISKILNFLIIALVVFIAYKVLSKYKIVEDKTKPETKDK